MIEIKNLRIEKPTNPWDVKVDRTSVLGNPFYMKDENQRDVVCDEYQEWFEDAMKVKPVVWTEVNRLAALYKLHGKLRLFCWCTPKRCHSETVKSWLETHLI